MGINIMYKIIACDLDETLLKLDRTIDPRDIEAVHSLRDKGIKFVPATGRGYTSVQGTLKELGLYNEPGEYVISYNGGAITENKDNRLIYFEELPFETADELYRRGLNYDVCIHVYTVDMVYIYNLTEDENRYLANRMAIEVTDSDNIEFLRGQDIAKVLYTNTDRAYLMSIENELKDITGDVSVTYSSNRYLEFNRKGIDKGAGLKMLAKILRTDPADIIAIGDNYNDIPMIRAAGLGVAVGNAVDSLKEESDYVTAATCDEAALAEVADKFIL